jgi:predicted PurR-regulated permease PerM
MERSLFVSEQHRQNEISAFAHRAVVAVGIALFGGILVLIAGKAIQVLLVTFAGVLLGIFLLALRDALCRHTPLSPGWSLAAVLVLLLGIFIAGGMVMAPRLAEQTDEFVTRLPRFAEQAEDFLGQYGWGRTLLESVQNGDSMEGLTEGIGTVFSVTVQGFGFFVTFLAVGFFVAVNPGLYYAGMVRLMPLGWRRRTGLVLEEIGAILRWFLVARAVAMSLVGLSTAIALMLLSVPLALFLGVLAGLLTFVPYLGPIIAGVPIVIVALLEGPEKGLYALLIYTVIQQVEGNIFDPLILQRVIHLPPAITVVAQILGAVLLGVMGIALATPFAAVMLVLVRRVYREDVLGEPVAEPES